MILLNRMNVSIFQRLICVLYFFINILDEEDQEQIDDQVESEGEHDEENDISDQEESHQENHQHDDDDGDDDNNDDEEYENNSLVKEEPDSAGNCSLVLINIIIRLISLTHTTRLYINILFIEN